MPSISDWNDGDPGGTHRMLAFECTSGTNAPTGNPLFGLAFRFDANNIYQLAINSNALWTRKRSFGNWTEWVKIGGGIRKHVLLRLFCLGGRHDQSCNRGYKSKVLYDNRRVRNVFTNCSDRDANNGSVNNICDVKFGPDHRIYRIWCDGSKFDKSGGYDDNQHNGSNPMVCALFKWCGNRQNTKSTIAVKGVA